jgi:hypothetical protein
MQPQPGQVPRPPVVQTQPRLPANIVVSSQAQMQMQMQAQRALAAGARPPPMSQQQPQQPPTTQFGQPQVRKMQSILARFKPDDEPARRQSMFLKVSITS